MRLLILPKRNYVTALVRPSYSNRGTNYTAFATTMRCVRSDQSSQTITVHYINDGTCTTRLTISKQESLFSYIFLFESALKFHKIDFENAFYDAI